MSEIVQQNVRHVDIRRKFLAGTSALALVAYVSSSETAIADSDSQPQVWIELGGQLSRLQSEQEPYAPPLVNGRPEIFSPSQRFEGLPLYSFDQSGKISIEPRGTDLVLSASVQYGRSAKTKHIHQQTHPSPFIVTKYGTPVPDISVPLLAARFADTLARTAESHMVLDFQAGKDVGLGVFGSHGSSVLSLGVRFAQFQSNSNITLKSDPDWAFHTKYIRGLKIARQPYHSNIAHMSASRSFNGVGPSLSWNASAQLMESDSRESEVTLDWGLNVAAIFGRQKAKIGHQETGRFHSSFMFTKGARTTVYHPTPVASDRAKSIVVPNIGGFGGVSWRIENFKASFGYRGDFFFSAMDGGIDQRNSENVGFHGPFATVSIGLGG